MLSTIQLIRYGSPEYAAALRLRHDLLRAPLGLDLFSEDLSAETEHLHIGLFEGEGFGSEADLLGVAVAVPQADAPDGARVAKVRQVAVRADRQRGGLGRALMDGAEAVLRGEGYGRAVLNARAHVVGFYERLGYERVGEVFVEVGIPHQTMTKVI